MVDELYEGVVQFISLVRLSEHFLILAGLIIAGILHQMLSNVITSGILNKVKGT